MQVVHAHMHAHAHRLIHTDLVISYEWNCLPHHLLNLESSDLFVVNVIACMQVASKSCVY